jgi:polyisoprenoid-binding protein YceI
MRFLKHCFFIALFSFFFSNVSQAKEWDVHYPSSRLWFEGTQNGKVFTGTFSVYQATIHFDPKHPETASVEVNVDLRSASTGDKERDKNLQAKDWFDTIGHPFAQLYAGKIRKLSDIKFELKGMFTLKDLTHDIIMPFTMEDERDASRVKGEFTVSRMDYNVGTGHWANELYVKYPVKIGIDLLAIGK